MLQEVDRGRKDLIMEVFLEKEITRSGFNIVRRDEVGNFHQAVRLSEIVLVKTQHFIIISLRRFTVKLVLTINFL